MLFLHLLVRFVEIIFEGASLEDFCFSYAFSIKADSFESAMFIYTLFTCKDKHN